MFNGNATDEGVLADDNVAGETTVADHSLVTHNHLPFQHTVDHSDVPIKLHFWLK